MFLNELTRKEKEAFMNLSVYAAKANGILANEEKIILDTYCKEMELLTFEMENIQPMEAIVDVFAQSDVHTNKIVMLELLGLVYADGEYDENEKSFINEYARKVGLSEDVINKLTQLIKSYLEILKKIADAVR